METIGGQVLEGAKNHTYGFEEQAFTIDVPPNAKQDFEEDAEGAIAYGIVHTLAQLEIGGGDVYAKRALAIILEQGGFDTSGSGTIDSVLNGKVAGDVETELDEKQVLDALLSGFVAAGEYRKYLENAETINTLIAADPNDPYTIGWQVTLSQIYGLGLHQRHAVDWNGGFDFWTEASAVSVV